MTDEELAARLDAFGKAQHALLERLDARLNQQEQMLAAYLMGYIKLTAMVEALIEYTGAKDDPKYTEIYVAKETKALTDLQAGNIHAGDKAEEFISTDTDTD